MTKFSMLKLSLIAAALTLTSTSNLRAQDAPPHARVTVPFAFEVGPTHFAPGTYTVGMMNGSLHVRGTQNGGFASVTRNESRSSAIASRVVFRRVGNEYFLGEVWTAGSAIHLVAYPTKAEKQAVRVELAANRLATQDVEISLVQADR
jgi:hypothetical protein